MTNGKAIFEVKLKHIVSKINLSMASSLCLSDSRAWRVTPSDLNRRRPRVDTHLRVYVYLSHECLGLEGFLGEPNGVRSS